MLDMCEDYQLITDELHFDFKHGYSCHVAIFALKAIVNVRWNGALSKSIKVKQVQDRVVFYHHPCLLFLLISLS